VGVGREQFANPLKVVAKSGIEPPAHGFSVPDPINAPRKFLYRAPSHKTQKSKEPP